MSKNKNSQSWKCSNCFEEIDNNFDICWNCGTTREGLINPHFKPVPKEASFCNDEMVIKRGILAKVFFPLKWCFRISVLYLLLAGFCTLVSGVK